MVDYFFLYKYKGVVIVGHHLVYLINKSKAKEIEFSINK